MYVSTMTKSVKPESFTSSRMILSYNQNTQSTKPTAGFLEEEDGF